MKYVPAPFYKALVILGTFAAGLAQAQTSVPKITCTAYTDDGGHVTPDHQIEIVNQIGITNTDVTVDGQEYLLPPSTSAFLSGAIVLTARTESSQGYEGNLGVIAYFYRDKSKYEKGNPGAFADATVSFTGPIGDKMVGTISRIRDASTYLTCKKK